MSKPLTKRTLAGVVGAAVVLGLITTMTASAPAAEDLATMCQSVGGVYTTSKGVKTCTVTTSMTFEGVQDGARGPMTWWPEGSSGSWETLHANWISDTDVEFTTTYRQKGQGAITESSSQTVTGYHDFHCAVCGAWTYDDTGAGVGGGLVDNTLCKDAGLMPMSAPEPSLEPCDRF